MTFPLSAHFVCSLNNDNLSRQRGKKRRQRVIDNIKMIPIKPYSELLCSSCSKGRNGRIPYIDYIGSKLTRILQSSLGGNARTAIVCTMNPAHTHIDQSRNTLLFATCAKEVVTNAQVNVMMSDKALLKYLQRELVRLENELKLQD